MHPRRNQTLEEEKNKSPRKPPRNLPRMLRQIRRRLLPEQLPHLPTIERVLKADNGGHRTMKHSNTALRDMTLSAELKRLQGQRVTNLLYIAGTCSHCSLKRWCAKYTGPQCKKAIRKSNRRNSPKLNGKDLPP